MVPYKDGKANHGHSCVKGRFAWGYATHRTASLKPMIREQDHRSLARSELGRGDRPRRLRVQAHPGEVRPRLDRRHHLLALHQRGDLSGAEAGARGFGNNNVDTCARVCHSPTGYGLKQDLRHLGRHAGFRLGRRVRRDHGDRRQPDRRASGVRLAHEAAAARGRQADRHRPAAHRPGAHAACRGRTIICSCGRAPMSRCSMRWRM